MEKFLFNGFLGRTFVEAFEKGICLCAGLRIGEAANGHHYSDYNKKVYKEVTSFLESFHMVESHSFAALDADIFCVRADHFVVEIGFSEFTHGVPKYWEKLFRGPNITDDPLQAVVWANDKGTRAVTIFTLPYSYNDLYRS